MNEKSESQFDFLKKAVHCSNDSNFNSDISGIKKVFNKYLMDVYQKSPQMHERLSDEYEHIKTYCAYPELAKKNIIALCGKHSAGKAAFFNSLYGGNILPTDTETLSDPDIYISCGNSDSVYAINRSDYYMALTNKEMHDAIKGTTSESSDIRLTIGHLFKSFLTFATSPSLKHVAFHKIPGYTTPNDNNFTMGSSQIETIKKANRSNAILWFSSIDPKTMSISENDINILKKINENIPKIIIINKADAYKSSDLPEVIEKTSKILNASNIRYIDILSYSDKAPEKYDKYRMLAYFDRWNKSPEVINFPQRFEKIFEKYSEHSSGSISKFKEELLFEVNKLNSEIYNLEKAFHADKKEGFVPIENIRSEKSNKSKNPLKNLDLSQIKISDLPIPNPEKLFRAYNDKTKKDLSKYERYINTVSIILSENMKNIDPVFSFSKRTMEYKKNISSIIAGAFNVDMAEKIEPEKEPETEKKPDKRSSRSERKSRISSERNSRLNRTDRNNDIKTENKSENEKPTDSPPVASSSNRQTNVFRRDNIPNSNNIQRRKYNR